MHCLFLSLFVDSFVIYSLQPDISKLIFLLYLRYVLRTERYYLS
jgi:hypothetical protein